MTTIIVVAIVALVFFVAIAVAVFMIWKQETQMRTDSLKGIEISLNEVLNEIAEKRTEFIPYHDIVSGETFERRKGKRGSFMKNNKGHTDHGKDIEVTVFKPSDLTPKRREAKETSAACDAQELIRVFEETHDFQKAPEIPKEDNKTNKPVISEEVSEQKKDSKQVDLSFIDIDDLFELDEIILKEDEHDHSSDYNTGKSGRKYTAEELESLIKE